MDGAAPILDFGKTFQRGHADNTHSIIGGAGGLGQRPCHKTFSEEGGLFFSLDPHADPLRAWVKKKPLRTGFFIVFDCAMADGTGEGPALPIVKSILSRRNQVRQTPKWSVIVYWLGRGVLFLVGVRARTLFTVRTHPHLRS